MGWRAVVRSLEAEARRQRRAAVTHARQQERAALQRRRELLMHQAANTIANDRRSVAMFDNYLELIVSVHKDCSMPWDWAGIAASSPPRPPQPSVQHEQSARAALERYRPGFFEKLFGKERARRAQLAAAVDAARQQDVDVNRAAAQLHEAELRSWEWFQGCARGILTRNAEAYVAALEHLILLDEMEEQLGSNFALRTVLPDAVAVDCHVRGSELVPEEEVSITARGNLSKKSMARGKYWALYQDHVCSCALRVAREVFALLPVDRVIVNVGTTATDTSTGHPTLATYLAVHFLRSRLLALNFDAIDPSDSMRNFDHRMRFKKSSGFTPVDPITVDEQWATGT